MPEINKIDKIFIIHYKELVERKTYLLNSLNKLGIKNYEFIENSYKDTITTETLDKYCKNNKLSLTEKCIAIAHIDIYRKIIEDKLQFCLILEDDAILDNDFVNRLNLYLETCPIDIEIACINNGCNLHINNGLIENNKYWYKTFYTRTCCSYLITNGCCQKLLNSIIPFDNAIDHELNKQIKNNDINMYWLEPTLVVDGSGYIFKSANLL